MSFTEIKQLLSTEVDAYRPKGFAKEIPEIVCSGLAWEF